MKLQEHEIGTRVLFGKLYHWSDKDGVIRLVRGPMPEPKTLHIQDYRS